ncbi:CCR4-associated factor 4 [Astathelohania contejeani]|uniref:CCR4-associated factor 4 n=1 Tax=Astathelohania contejeani TaxID=164912 RepID=A0ABQ7HZA2_9MICR|nr:CCR4-associated factor 4 [Thelohania contejeani]
MISSIQFLEKGIECSKLDPYKFDGQIPNKFAGMELPSLDFEEETSDNSDDYSIKNSDIMLFCTPNDEEMSYLQFYIYGDNQFYVHHDIYVYDTIVDSAYVQLERPWAALATFDNDVWMYDALTFNPLFPQLLLKGHEDSINCISWNKKCLVTTSNDNTLIRWDVGVNKIIERTKIGKASKLINDESGKIIFSNENELNILCGTDKISLDNKGIVESMRLDGYLLYTGDDLGIFRSYDIRNFKKRINKFKFHDEGITTIDLDNERIITGSLDQKIKIWDKTDLNEIRNIDTSDSIFSVRICEYNPDFCVYGGLKDELKKL